VLAIALGLLALLAWGLHRLARSAPQQLVAPPVQQGRMGGRRPVAALP
jgi:hypothetical protein